MLLDNVNPAIIYIFWKGGKMIHLWAKSRLDWESVEESLGEAAYGLGLDS